MNENWATNWYFLALSVAVNPKFPISSKKLSTICLVILAATYSQSETLITQWDDDMNMEEELSWQLSDNYSIIP